MLGARGGGVSGRPHLIEVGVRWPPETFVRRKLELLSAAGMRVTVAAALPSGAPRPSIPGIELRRLPHWRTPPWRKLLKVATSGPALLLRRPRRAMALLAAIRGPLAPRGASGFWHAVHLLHTYLPLARLDPDLVQYEWETAAVEYLPLTKVWDCPILMACRGGAVTVYPNVPGHHWVERLPAAFERAAAVHCVSEATVAEAARHGLDRAKAHVVRTSVDAEFFTPPESRDASPDLRVVAVGTLRWLKGHEYAVEVMARLRALGVPARLDVVGGDPAQEIEETSERGRVLWTAVDAGLDGRVVLHGEAGRHDVRRLLRGADVLLHTSLVEGIPNAVLEAMACGLPVVVSDCGGVREAVDDCVEGFVVPPRDTPAMASALDRLWRDPELRRRMGGAARRRAAGFTAERQLEGFLSMIGAANGGVPLR